MLKKVSYSKYNSRENQVPNFICYEEMDWNYIFSRAVKFRA
jgi:hypothetical protein